jgi:hypothetical protein
MDLHLHEKTKSCSMQVAQYDESIGIELPLLCLEDKIVQLPRLDHQ